MSSFAFDIEKPCVQLGPWAPCTETVVALQHEVQNHCRGENPKTRSPTWKGSHQSQRCLGAETGGQSHPHCAPVVACIKAHRGYPRVGSKPAIRAGCCLSGGENRQQRPQQLGQFRGAPQAWRGPGSVWESVSGADSFPLGEGPSSSCLRTGSLAWRSSLHHRGFGSPGGWEMFCLPRSNTF